MDLSKLKNKKILVVEDDHTNSELIIEIFSNMGIIIKTVTTGIEAVEICKNEKFDIVLMDIQLPLKNGYEATKEIKVLQPELVVIAQTAYAFETDRLLALDSGCSDYIAKPFRKEELLRIVLKYI